MVLVKVRWMKETYEVEVDPDTMTVEDFRAILYSLTMVPPDRQKVMGVKGGMLKDEANLADVGLRPGMQLMLIGNAEEAPSAPAEKTVFMEDVTHQGGSVSAITPPGLQNLGNTCYLNSSLQALKTVPELVESIPRTEVAQNNPNAILVETLRRTLGQMDSQMDSFAPAIFLQALRTCFPQFAEQERGHYMQQDAEEVWNQLLSTLKVQIPGGLIDQLFGIKLHTVLQNQEVEGEEPTIMEEDVLRLQCNIGKDTNYLLQGMEQSLVGDVEKISETAGRSCVYRKMSQVSQLPPYLTVQMMRFSWRQDSQKKAKILRAVKFPIKLDVFSLCTPELQAELQEHRTHADEIMELTVNRQRDGAWLPEWAQLSSTTKKAIKRGGGASAASSSSDAPAASSSSSADHGDMTLEEKQELEDKLSLKGSCGVYELSAIVTHMGRSSDSGHYIGWARGKSGAWFKFDDDKVEEVTEDKLSELAGGGEWHTTYILLYRSRDSNGRFLLPG